MKRVNWYVALTEMMLSPKASRPVSFRRRRCLAKLRLMFSGVDGWYVTPKLRLKNFPVPGSNGARHTGGRFGPLHRPAATAARCVTAGILGRGDFGWLPK